MIGLLMFAAAAAAAASPTPTVPPSLPKAAAAVQLQYVVGQTTMAEVIAKLGKPNSVNTSATGTVLMYTKTKSHIKGASFVPIVGLFAGGAKTHYSFSMFTFGADGLLKDYSISNGNGNCDVSVIGGVGCH